MFEHLLNDAEDQVFLMECPANIPFVFAVHPWLVVNQKGVVSRWEVTFQARNRELSWGHLNRDLYPPTQGIEIVPLLAKPHWSGRLVGHVEGSLAVQMGEFISDSVEQYPYCDRYSLTGPNSNTYVQWVLDQFPESSLQLPWNSFGKNRPCP